MFDNIEMNLDDWEFLGFKDGREDGLNNNCQHPQAEPRVFRTAHEEFAYEKGYNAGYNSIDD